MPARRRGRFQKKKSTLVVEARGCAGRLASSEF
jgi:hypothetical protein